MAGSSGGGRGIKKVAGRKPFPPERGLIGWAKRVRGRRLRRIKGSTQRGDGEMGGVCGGSEWAFPRTWEERNYCRNGPVVSFSFRERREGKGREGRQQCFQPAKVRKRREREGCPTVPKSWCGWVGRNFEWRWVTRGENRGFRGSSV